LGVLSHPRDQAYIRGAGRARPIGHWRVHVALSYFRAAAILHGVWARAMQVRKFIATCFLTVFFECL
jgi:hypothetical protein